MIGGLSRKGETEEFEFWTDHDVDFIMLSVAYDFFLDVKTGIKCLTKAKQKA